MEKIASTDLWEWFFFEIYIYRERERERERERVVRGRHGDKEN